MGRRVFLTENRFPLPFKVGKIPKELTEKLCLTEYKNNGQLDISLPVTILDRENLNHRVYPSEVMEAAIKKAKPLMETGRLLGAGDDHPQTPYVSPIKASHMILDAWTESFKGTKYLLNKWRTLLTTNGKDLKGFFESGASGGASIRGFGEVEDSHDSSSFRYNGGGLTGKTRSGSSPQRIKAYEFLGTDMVGEPSAQVYVGIHQPYVNILEAILPGASALGKIQCGFCNSKFDILGDSAFHMYVNHADKYEQKEAELMKESFDPRLFKVGTRVRIGDAHQSKSPGQEGYIEAAWPETGNFWVNVGGSNIIIPGEYLEVLDESVDGQQSQQDDDRFGMQVKLSQIAHENDGEMAHQSQEMGEDESDANDDNPEFAARKRAMAHQKSVEQNPVRSKWGRVGSVESQDNEDSDYIEEYGSESGEPVPHDYDNDNVPVFSDPEDEKSESEVDLIAGFVGATKKHHEYEDEPGDHTHDRAFDGLKVHSTPEDDMAQRRAAGVASHLAADPYWGHGRTQAESTEDNANDFVEQQSARNDERLLDSFFKEYGDETGTSVHHDMDGMDVHADPEDEKSQEEVRKIAAHLASDPYWGHGRTTAESRQEKEDEKYLRKHKAIINGVIESSDDMEGMVGIDHKAGHEELHDMPGPEDGNEDDEHDLDGLEVLGDMDGDPNEDNPHQHHAQVESTGYAAGMGTNMSCPNCGGSDIDRGICTECKTKMPMGEKAAKFHIRKHCKNCKKVTTHKHIGSGKHACVNCGRIGKRIEEGAASEVNTKYLNSQILTGPMKDLYEKIKTEAGDQVAMQFYRMANDNIAYSDVPPTDFDKLVESPQAVKQIYRVLQDESHRHQLNALKYNIEKWSDHYGINLREDVNNEIMALEFTIPKLVHEGNVAEAVKQLTKFESSVTNPGITFEDAGKIIKVAQRIKDRIYTVEKNQDSEDDPDALIAEYNASITNESVDDLIAQNKIMRRMMEAGYRTMARQKSNILQLKQDNSTYQSAARNASMKTQIAESILDELREALISTKQLSTNQQTILEGLITDLRERLIKNNVNRPAMVVPKEIRDLVESTISMNNWLEPFREELLQSRTVDDVRGRAVKYSNIPLRGIKHLYESNQSDTRIGMDVTKYGR